MMPIFITEKERKKKPKFINEATQRMQCSVNAVMDPSYAKEA